MDFVTALKYPFNSTAKVISIVLVMTIAFAACLALVVSAYDWSPYVTAIQDSMATGANYSAEHEAMGGTALLGLLGLFVVAVVEGFWISGYSVDVIRSVMAGREALPAVEFGKNVGAGFYLFLSALLYGLLFILYAIVAVLLVSVFGESGLASLFAIAAGVAAIPLLFIMGWGYYIGMARYAAEGNRSAVFQIQANMRTARANLSPSISLVGYQILLGIIYHIVSRVAEGVFGGIAGPDVLLTLTISTIVFFMLNLFQHFSGQHLIAQYALRIGISGQGLPKDKVDFGD